jgi:hypothetical protein
VRAGYRVLLVCVLVGLLGTASVAVAEPVLTQTVETVRVLAQQQPGPNIQPPPTTPDPSTSQNKLVIGIIAAVLLAIVILGHRVRAKRKKNS